MLQSSIKKVVSGKKPYLVGTCEIKSRKFYMVFKITHKTKKKLEYLCKSIVFIHVYSFVFFFVVFPKRITVKISPNINLLC